MYFSRHVPVLWPLNTQVLEMRSSFFLWRKGPTRRGELGWRHFSCLLTCLISKVKRPSEKLSLLRILLSPTGNDGLVLVIFFICFFRSEKSDKGAVRCRLLSRPSTQRSFPLQKYKCDFVVMGFATIADVTEGSFQRVDRCCILIAAVAIDFITKIIRPEYSPQCKLPELWRRLNANSYIALLRHVGFWIKISSWRKRS